MSEPLRQIEQPESPQRAPKATTRRSHRLARWLGAIVALLIVLAVIGGIAWHQLALTNQTLARISSEVNQGALQRAHFQGAV